MCSKGKYSAEFMAQLKTRVSGEVNKQSKAVPLHATQALGGSGGIAPTHSRPRHYMGWSGQRHAPAALCPRERTPGTHCTGGWVGPGAGLDTETRGKILCPCRGSNPDRPVVQSVVKTLYWLSYPRSQWRSRHNKDGGSTHLWNVGRQSFYTAVQPRRQLWTVSWLV
jgi:hypothetical protein